MRKKVSAMLEIVVCDDDMADLECAVDMLHKIFTNQKIASIPESSREEMFELAKKEFLNENGTLNGDTTKRESVYNNLYRKMDKDDRLSAGWTMEQYEHQYRQAFAEAVKAADPTWKAGKPIPAGALDGITRESVESGRKSVDIKV